MKKYFFLLLIIFCCHRAIALPLINIANNSLSYKPTDQNPLKKIIKKIAKANVYDATPIESNHKIISEQEMNYQDLLNTASSEQLTDLATNNKNAVVRLYAFRALMEKEKKVPNSLYTQFANDNAGIRVINGKFAEMKPINTISNGFLY